MIYTEHRDWFKKLRIKGTTRSERVCTFSVYSNWQCQIDTHFQRSSSKEPTEPSSQNVRTFQKEQQHGAKEIATTTFQIVGCQQSKATGLLQSKLQREPGPAEQPIVHLVLQSSIAILPEKNERHQQHKIQEPTEETATILELWEQERPVSH